VDDARLVVLNALDAKERGATILTRTAATSARRKSGAWDIEFRGGDGTLSRVRAKALVNAAGPWVEDVISGVVGVNSTRRVRLVKGSHIIVRKFWDGPHAYLLQNHDKRVIFVNPYEDDLCLIGTTDIPYEGRAEDVSIDTQEIDYLLAAVNRYIKKQLTRADIIGSFSGVRPLSDDNAANPSAVTRDYVFDCEGEPPLLSVFGGKITTYRKLAEHALQKLKPFFPSMRGDWTARAVARDSRATQFRPNTRAPRTEAFRAGGTGRGREGSADVPGQRDFAPEPRRPAGPALGRPARRSGGTPPHRTDQPRRL
jgi:glycerol-3-phosphate dehydrogenase